MEAIKEWEKAIEQNYEETVNFMVKILVELLFYMVQLPPHVAFNSPYWVLQLWKTQNF